MLYKILDITEFCAAAQPLSREDDIQFYCKLPLSRRSIHRFTSSKLLVYMCRSAQFSNTRAHTHCH